jgi:hypothetical protein
LRKILAIAVVGFGLGALTVPGLVAATGVASHDLKRDVVSNSIGLGSGLRTVSVTCPDGGVPITMYASGVDGNSDPGYYHRSESVAVSGHVVTATFGADYDDSVDTTGVVGATCISLAD